jgi:DNA-binding transcriptional ArsR family regulator
MGRTSLETQVLRALASPVRQEILDVLARGPATSAMLARSLSSNTGVTSYHLRELGKAGLIERDAQQGRALYWRLSHNDIQFSDPQVSPDPALARSAVELTMAQFAASVTTYLDRCDLESVWHEAALFSQSATTLTAAELAEFGREYLTLLKRWAGRSGSSDAARPVRLALFAYPAGDPLPDPVNPQEPANDRDG